LKSFFFTRIIFLPRSSSEVCFAGGKFKLIFFLKLKQM